MIWKMMLNVVPSLARCSHAAMGTPSVPAMDTGVLDSTKISGLSALFRIFILALRDVSKVRANSHSSLGSLNVFQYAKHCERRIVALGGITIDCRDESETAFVSLRAHREFTSNEIEPTPE
jgi:hypothetical protein